MSNSSPFAMPSAIPFYSEYGLYNLRQGALRPWEFNGWKAESLSWKKTCYIHGGLSGPGQYVYRGPDAEQFLSGLCVNNFSKFKAGTAKHAIMCTDDGFVAAHGVLQRMTQTDFRIYACGAWPSYMHSKTNLDVRQEVENNYLFQVAGPTSLQTLESAAQESLRDVGFLRYKNICIAGKPVEIMRLGMAGTLGYELHGRIEDGPEIYDAVVQAGKPYGIERLGWKTYFVNHVEGGFPQQTWTFLSASYSDPGFQTFHRPDSARAPIFSGSVDPADIRARYRTPVEVGWSQSIKFDHEFLGRSALEKETSKPEKTIVTLVWNSEDVVDIYASLFQGGEEYTYLEMPTSPHGRGNIGHADHVLKDGKKVGISSGTIYSYHFRKVISMCSINLDAAIIGAEVLIKWGNFGGRIKDVRATVGRFPFLSEERNQDVDLDSIPPFSKVR